MDAATIISLASTVIAALALALSIYTLYAQRQDNKPKLKIMGTISIDSSTSLQATRWEVDDTVTKLMRDWAYILSRLLKA